MDKQLMKNVKEAFIIVGLSAAMGFLGKKAFKENLISDPSANVMSFIEWVFVVTVALFVMQYLIAQNFIPA